MNVTVPGSSFCAFTLAGILLTVHTQLWSQSVVTSNVDDGTPGTLRYVVEHASTGDEVTFEPTVGDTIRLLLGEIRIDKALSIKGPGMDGLTISGNGLSRTFRVDTETVFFSGLTLAEGRAPAGTCGGGLVIVDAQVYLDHVRVSDNRAGDGVWNPPARRGGGGFGGGICVASGKLWIRDSEVSRNQAGNGTGEPAAQGGYGGGIYGTADLERVLVSNNSAGDGGDGLTGGTFSNGGDGGGLYGWMDIRDSRIMDNRAGKGGSRESGVSGTGGLGGGAFLTGSSLIRTHVSGNRAGDGGNGRVGGIGGDGGGLAGSRLIIELSQIAHNSAGSGGVGSLVSLSNGGNGGGIATDGNLTVSLSTIMFNETGLKGTGGADGNGGGMFLNDWDPTSVFLDRVTITGNQARGAGLGGAVYLYPFFRPGPLRIKSSTITQNIGGGAALFLEAAGLRELEVTNSIIINNESRTNSPDGCDFGGSPFIGSNNLVNEGSGCPLAPNTLMVKRQHARNRVLEPLGDNGGPTLTHALRRSSLAIDAGYCPDETSDQRRYGNPAGGRAVDLRKKDASTACDIGSFEFRAVPVSEVEVVQKVDRRPDLASGDVISLIAVHPNPSARSAQSAFTVSEGQDIRAAVYDLLGREVRVLFHGSVPRGRSYPLLIPVSDLSPGHYFLRVTGRSVSALRTFVVSK